MTFHFHVDDLVFVRGTGRCYRIIACHGDIAGKEGYTVQGLLSPKHSPWPIQVENSWERVIPTFAGPIYGPEPKTKKKSRKIWRLVFSSGR